MQARLWVRRGRKGEGRRFRLEWGSWKETVVTIGDTYHLSVRVYDGGYGVFVKAVLVHYSCFVLVSSLRARGLLL